MESALTMVRAGPSDVETIAEILEEAGRWLLGRGIKQWSAEIDRERLSQTVVQHAVYLVYEDAIPIGTLTLQDSDVVVWGERPPDAFYVHGLAIRRVVGGRGVGAHMLEWVAQQVIATGKSYLRLDCWAENQALRAYYERIGFTFCGRRDFPNGWSCGLYEKKLA